MKRILTILLLSMLALGMSAQGDYTSLLKQVEKAQEKDQPKTALSAAKKIEAKAEKEKHYGHLFAALYAGIRNVSTGRLYISLEASRESSGEGSA